MSWTLPDRISLPTTTIAQLRSRMSNRPVAYYRSPPEPGSSPGLIDVLGLLLDKLAAGETAEQIHRSYPHLPTGSINAALSYAAAVVRNEVVVSMSRLSA